MSNNKNIYRGFTLIESMLSLVVLTMVALGVYLFQHNIFSTSRWFNGNLLSQQQVQTLFKQFEREARAMAPSQAGAYPIMTASSTEFSFYTDYDRDGYVERVRYYYSTSTKRIYKGVIEPSGAGTTTYATSSEVVSTVVENVYSTATNTAMFSYYNSGYDGVGTNTPMTQPVSIPTIRHVRVLIGVVPKGQNNNSTSSTMFFQTEVTPRNLKDNL